MAQLLVRDLEEEVVQALRQKAVEEGTSVEEVTAVFCEVSYYPRKPPRLSKKHCLKCQTMGTTRLLNVSEGNLAMSFFNALFARHEYTVRTA